MAFLYSCEEPFTPALAVGEKAVNFKADEGLRKTVAITSNTAWTVSCDAEWVSIEPASGEGDANITITVTENTGIEERSADVKVTAGELSETIKVAQLAAAPSISIDNDALVASAEASSLTITVTANAPWSVVPQNGWVTVTPSSGEAGETTVTVAFDENISLRERQTTVAFKTTAGAAQAIASLSQTGCQPCRRTDSLALVAIYNASNGASWKADKVWDLTKPMDDATAKWSGVTVADGRVTKVLFTAKDIITSEWTLPEEIGDLTELIQLKFNNCKLTGNLPASLYSLEKLEVLYFQTNDISASGIENIGQLTKLKQLYVNDNANMTGTLPAAIGDLKNLQQFQIGNTKIGGNVDVLGGCTALVGVNAYNANLAGTVPEAFGNLSAVTTIRLEDNDITGNIPESFGNLPAKCTDLRLSGNKMSGVVPAAVKSHANWATGTKKWNPATNILPQQEGFGLTE